MTSSGSFTTSTKISVRPTTWWINTLTSSRNFKTPFDVEAKKYDVYPLDSSMASRVDPAIRPSLTRGRTEFTYYPGMIRIPEGSAADLSTLSSSGYGCPFWVISGHVTVLCGSPLWLGKQTRPGRDFANGFANEPRSTGWDGALQAG